MRRRAGPLVVATTDPRRAAAWRALLEETRQARREAPFPAVIVTWDEIRACPEALAAPETARPRPVDVLVERVRLPPRRPRGGIA